MAKKSSNAAPMAWARLLAPFRACSCWVSHPGIACFSLGGSPFDPGQISFSGMPGKGTGWQTTPAPLDQQSRGVAPAEGRCRFCLKVSGRRPSRGAGVSFSSSR